MPKKAIVSFWIIRTHWLQLSTAAVGFFILEKNATLFLEDKRRKKSGVSVRA
jgi:hypothetical protein